MIWFGDEAAGHIAFHEGRGTVSCVELLGATCFLHLLGATGSAKRTPRETPMVAFHHGSTPVLSDRGALSPSLRPATAR